MAAHKIQSAICIDCETGGLSALKNPMCSIAMISFGLYDGKELGRYESYIKPYGDLSYEEKAMQYTGITYAKLNTGKTIKEVVTDLCEQFSLANPFGHTKKPILVGHNIMFDIQFITYAFNLCRVDISKYLDCKEDALGNPYPSYFDTMWLSRMKWGGDESMIKYNLDACCTKANVSLTDAHDAMNDVVATKDLFIHFMNGLRTSGNDLQQGNEGDIIKHRVRKHFQF